MDRKLPAKKKRKPTDGNRNTERHRHPAGAANRNENKEEKGYFWHLRYPLADGQKTQDGKDYVIVATTRPETMLGDTAVAVHPEDERYQHLIGQHVLLPLVNRRIPIVADHHADPEKGSGCVKITPAHDFNDYAVGKRNNLPMINVMTQDANIREIAEVFNADGTENSEINSALPAAYAGLSREAARKQIVADMELAGLVEKIEDHVLSVPRGDRSGLIIEPMLTDQWFADAKTLAKPAIEAVEDGRIQFVPKQYENMYFAWMRDIQDWCISRQLWWGHRIPAWYDEAGNVYVGRDEEEAYRKALESNDREAEAELPTLDELKNAAIACGLGVLRQDEDVLDTWFSSGLWTFSTLGWPEQTEALKTFHPTDVLVTGFDIIFFWVARMIMLTMHLMKHDDGTAQIPFKTVYVHGLVRDGQGQKMSKSKGNVLDPLDIIDGIDLESLVKKRTSGMMQPKLAAKIEKQTRAEFPDGIAAYGTDALRFTNCSLASTGRDIKFDMGRVEGYRNFCNKIWNAARYVMMQCEDKDTGVNGEAVELTLADRWIISQLQRTEAEVTRQLDQFRFDLASNALYEFIWNQYCDWYLELSKPVLWDENAPAERQRGTRRTLVRVLETALRLAHPFMPFITEEIWQRIAPMAGKSGPTIMLQPWPEADNSRIDAGAEGDAEWLKSLILGVRNIRGEMNVAPGKELEVMLRKASDEDIRRLTENETFLKKLAKLSSVQVLAENEEAPLAATALVGELEVLVPMAGLIDKTAELARLDKEIGRLDGEVKRIGGKLSNAGFVDKAPAAVIDKERAKLADAEQALAQLSEQRARIASL